MNTLAAAALLSMLVLLFSSEGQLILDKLAEIETHLKDLTTLRDELTLLLNMCRASEEGCPIIEDLDIDEQNH